MHVFSGSEPFWAKPGREGIDGRFFVNQRHFPLNGKGEK